MAEPDWDYVTIKVINKLIQKTKLELMVKQL